MCCQSEWALRIRLAIARTSRWALVMWTRKCVSLNVTACCLSFRLQKRTSCETLHVFHEYSARFNVWNIHDFILRKLNCTADALHHLWQNRLVWCKVSSFFIGCFQVLTPGFCFHFSVLQELSEAPVSFDPIESKGWHNLCARKGVRYWSLLVHQPVITVSHSSTYGSWKLVTPGMNNKMFVWSAPLEFGSETYPLLGLIVWTGELLVSHIRCKIDKETVSDQTYSPECLTQRQAEKASGLFLHATNQCPELSLHDRTLEWAKAWKVHQFCATCCEIASLRLGDSGNQPGMIDSASFPHKINPSPLQ